MVEYTNGFYLPQIELIREPYECKREATKSCVEQLVDHLLSVDKSIIKEMLYADDTTPQQEEILAALYDAK